MTKKTITVGAEVFEVYLPERKIQKRIKEIAREINRDYKGKCPVALGILNGSFLFYADLVRNLTIDCEVAFLQLSSYGMKRKSSGKITLSAPLPLMLKDRDVLVIEDVVDSGNTVEFLAKALKESKVRSFRIISLLYKNEAAKKSVTIDYIGFRIPNDFVIGYGLDLAQKKRNLRDVYRLTELI